MASLFHASLLAGLLAAVVSAVCSVLFLRTRRFVHDSLALAVTEAGLAILAAGIVAGTIAYRTPSGQWWTWDSGLTAALVCFLLYAPYLMLRNAIEEPTRRASAASVVSLFAIADMPFLVVAIRRWLPQRGAPAASGEAIWWLAVLAGGAAFTAVRFRQEQRRRAADAARRTSQEL